MAFKVGDRVRSTLLTGEFDVVAGPDAEGAYCVRRTDNNLFIQPSEWLSHLPRTLADVEAWVACRLKGERFADWAHFRTDEEQVYICQEHGAIVFKPKTAVGKPSELLVSKVLGPVRVVIDEGGEG